MLRKQIIVLFYIAVLMISISFLVCFFENKYEELSVGDRVIVMMDNNSIEDFVSRPVCELEMSNSINSYRINYLIQRIAMNPEHIRIADGSNYFAISYIKEYGNDSKFFVSIDIASSRYMESELINIILSECNKKD